MKFTRLSAALVTIVSVTTMACKTDLTGLNVNPNSPTTAPAGSLFTNATVTLMGRWNNTGGTLSGASLFAQHAAQVQYVEEDRGHLRATTIDGFNSGAYAGELEDYQKVQGIGKAGASVATWAPAAVMQSLDFQLLTDMWGDIPYSQALQGDVAGGSLRPVHDAQKDIYYGLLKTLTDASTALRAAPATDAGLGSADIIYKGDVTKWAKFANSLRARLALRMSKADPTKAATELTAAFAAGVMTSNSDNAQMAWPGDGVFDNPLATNFSTRDDHRISKTLLDTMNALADPRMKVYAQPTLWDPATKKPWAAGVTPQYVGLQNGLDNTTVAPFFNTTSRPGAMFYPGATSYGTFGTAAGKKTPSYLLTYAEVAFTQAECAERGLGGLSGAAAYYNAAVTSSMTQWGVSAADAAAYLASPGVAYKGGAAGLQQIGLQKWIALFTQSHEAWSEWRRTGNPATVKMGPSAYPDVPTIPRRYPYPSNELSVNAINLAAAIARQGPDLYTTRIWWDK